MSAPATLRSSGGRRRAPSTKQAFVLRPTIVQLIDIAFVACLCLLALCGLRSTYGGQVYLLVGVVGIVLGVVIGYLGAALRVPLLGVAAATVVVFFGVGILLPGPRSLTGVADLTVHGWKQLLTTLPPIGSSGPLLGLPFVLTLVAATLGTGLALRTRPAFAPLIGPAALFAAVILLGQPHATGWLLGAGFAAAAVAWAALRHQRTRPTVQHGSRQTTRALLGVAMLAVAGLGASVLAPGLPLADARDRVVLRNYVHQPFDVSQFPSPLAGFRKYVKTGPDYDKVLFTATGLPDGTPVRIAALDSYDGNVWGASGATSPGTFQRVGTSITTDASGPTASVTVRIGPAYDDVWLPSAGEASKVRFAGTDRKADTSSFRFNLATSTGVVPAGLREGDTVTVRAVVPPAVDLAHVNPYGSSGLTADYTSFLQSAVNLASRGVSGPWAQLQAFARHLKDDGKYSDGAGDEVIYTAGHNLGRLTSFLSGRQIVGNDEQYAAVFALAANSLGFPARAVLGALPEADGMVKGKDVHAWIELQVGENTWATVPTNEFMPSTDKKPDKPQQQQQQNSPAAVVPPPNAAHPPSTLDNPDQTDTRVDRRNASKKPAAAGSGGFHIPRFVVLAGTYGGPPLLLIMLVLLGIAALKAGRRRRRRTRGAVTARVAAGWRELLDHAHDLGTSVPSGRTRREAARALDGFALDPLAASADQVVFGPGEPGPDAAHWYWSEVDRARRRMSGGVGRWRRLRAAVSLRSLRRAG